MAQDYINFLTRKILLWKCDNLQNTRQHCCLVHPWHRMNPVTAPRSQADKGNAAAVTVQLLDLSEPFNFAGVKVWCLGNEGVLKYKYDSERSRHRRMVNTAHIAEDEGGHIQHTESCTQTNACNNAYAVSRDYEQFLALRNQPIIFGIFSASLHYFMIENYYDMHRYQALWIQRLRMRELAPEPPDQGSHDPASVMMKPWL